MRLEFKSKKLKTFFEKGSSPGVLKVHERRLKEVLMILMDANSIQDLLQIKGTHPMSSGSPYKGYWAIRVSGAWRLVFRINEEKISDLDYVQYH